MKLTPFHFRFVIAIIASCVCLNSNAQEKTLHAFKKLHLDKYYWSEGANFGDLNNDGLLDAISGPYWWAAPDYTQRREIYLALESFKVQGDDGQEKALPGYEGAFGKKNAYSRDNFFSFVYDFNKDGWNDVLTYGLPNTPAYLYLNPKGENRHWDRHTVLDMVDNESPTFVDLTGDGLPEIICNYEGNFGYASPDWSHPTQPWPFKPISSNGEWSRYTHGLGVGDVNGDGRSDILFKSGWWEQPASPGDEWIMHPAPFSPGGGAQMFAYDVNGDGRNDVITALAAHGYGLAWYEQLAEKDNAGHPQFKAHAFMNKEPSENRYGVTFSQLHAVELIDMNQDGLMDILTGKCYWAHGPTMDPDPNADAVLYWFELVRGENGSVDWVPHLIDNDSGVGRQIGIADANRDGWLDIVIGNKKGTFVFLHQAKSVSMDAWKRVRPEIRFPGFGDQELKANEIINRTGQSR